MTSTATTDAPTLPPLSSAGEAFRVIAIAEAVSWLGLLAGMFVKYVLESGEAGVQIFGRIHGGVVLVYVVVTLVTARRHRWSPTQIVVGLLASIPPLATVVFERWAHRQGLLSDRPA